MNRKEVYRRLKPVKDAVIIVGIAAALLPIAAGVASLAIENVIAENMLARLKLSGNIPVGGFIFSEDGKEASFNLNLPQKDGTTHSLTVVFSRNNISETVANGPTSVKINPGNIVTSKNISFSPFSFPHSKVMDLKASEKVKLEGRVTVNFSTNKSLADFRNQKS